MEEGKLSVREVAELKPWQPESTLGELELNEVRFSRGFLRADPRPWFRGIAAHWLPLFHSLGVEARLVSLQLGLDFPESLQRIVPIEIDGEPAVLGLDEQSVGCLVHAVSPDVTGPGVLLVQEYLERRFLSTASMSWSGSSPLLCYYAPPDIRDSVEVVGSACITVEIKNQPCSIWVGIGSKALGRFDLLWRERVVEQGLMGAEVSEETSEVNILLAELAVPPALLIDYMRSGTVIDLESPISETVLIDVAGKPFAEGRLRQFNGRFAVEITKLEPPKRSFPENTTRMQVSIARAELDSSAVIEHSQEGAVLLTRTPVGTTASLVISGEDIASAVVGQIDGRFALNVLPK